MIMNRRNFLMAAVGGVAATSMTPRVHAAEPAAPKPNIIFLFADDLGYGDLGCYGQKQILTPNIDRLAAEGMKFTDHYAGNTVCAPSRCALMTGYHMGHAYIRDNGKNSIGPKDVTIPELLKKAGYATGMVGKWGIGHEGSEGVPTKKGFDHFFGYMDQMHAHNYYPSFLMRGEERVPLKNVVPNEGQYGEGVASKKVEYSHDLFAADALEFISGHNDQTFFLYMAMTIPHANNEGGDDGMEVPSLAPYEDKDWPKAEKGLAAMITRMDKDIGRVMALLKELGLDEKTLVIFTSDNGPHKEGGNDPAFFKSWGPLRGYKRDMYDGGIREPMIARWPGHIEAGAVSNHVSAFWDFMPTFCDLAGVAPPKGIDGISMLPTLLGHPEKQKQHDYLYWEFQEKQAIRWGDWKGVSLGDDVPLEVYNLKDDLGETTNVAKIYPEIAVRLEKLMQEAHTPSELFPDSGRGPAKPPQPL